jgi:hypothetical protein
MKGARTRSSDAGRHCKPGPKRAIEAMRSILVVAALAVWPALASAQPPSPPGERAGDRYELVKSYETAMQRGDDSSGSSQGHETLLERVVAVRPDGLELEYRGAKPASRKERESDWRFPARVFRPTGGKPQLLNQPELEARLDGWLKKRKIPRAACGRWGFTWTAVKIECDPQSVVATIQSYDLRSPDLREGALHQEEEALASAALALQSTGPEGSTFAVRMEIDPQAVRRARAESDVVVGEIMGEPVTLEAAAAKRAEERITGTIAVTFVADRAGRPIRRTKVVKLETEADGVTQTDTASETLERRSVSRRTTRR